jgi:hypothetical protein
MREKISRTDEVARTNETKEREGREQLRSVGFEFMEELWQDPAHRGIDACS